MDPEGSAVQQGLTEGLLWLDTQLLSSHRGQAVVERTYQKCFLS